MNEWDHFGAMYEDFQDKEFRDGHDLKVLSIKASKAAILALMTEGKKFMDLDSDLVAGQLLETNSRLERS